MNTLAYVLGGCRKPFLAKGSLEFDVVRISAVHKDGSVVCAAVCKFEAVAFVTSSPDRASRPPQMLSQLFLTKLFDLDNAKGITVGDILAIIFVEARRSRLPVSASP